MGVEIGTILAAGGVICGIAFGFIGWKRTTQKDSYDEGGNHGAMQADISYIKRRTDDTLLEIKDMNRRLDTQGERITRVEESTKQAHKRIDSLEFEIRDK